MTGLGISCLSALVTLLLSAPGFWNTAQSILLAASQDEVASASGASSEEAARTSNVDARSAPGFWKPLLDRPHSIPPGRKEVTDTDEITIDGLWGPPQVDWSDSTFREYRIVSARHGELIREPIPCDGRGGYWSDDVYAFVQPWRENWVAQVSAYCSPSYPDADEQTRYVLLRGNDRDGIVDSVLALSDWTDVGWRPGEDGDAAEAWGLQGCVSFSAPLRAVRDGSTLRFVHVVPEDAGPDSSFVVPAYYRGQFYGDDRSKPIPISYLPTRDAANPETVSVTPEQIDADSVAVRWHTGEDGWTRIEVLAIELVLAGTRGWVEPAAFEALGFTGP
ncbi:MAG: hypothetical protein R3E97_12900 [Candidatus Eisenbacteria bacterium]